VTDEIPLRVPAGAQPENYTDYTDPIFIRTKSSRSERVTEQYDIVENRNTETRNGE